MPRPLELAGLAAVLTMMRLLLLFSCLLFTISGSPAFAQGAPSGFELALHGTTKVLWGRSARFRGFAYQVRGLAELRALPGAQVRARYKSDAEATAAAPWQTVRSDARGFFQIDVPIPAEGPGTPGLQVSVGDGTAERSFMFPLTVEPPFTFELFTDRNLYEPGETVHIFGRLLDLRSRRPLSQKAVTFKTDTTVLSVTTDESGVAAVAVPLSQGAVEGSYEVTAEIGTERVRRAYRIGTRVMARLLSEVKVTPKTAQPGQPVEVEVKVQTPSGAAVRNAVVVVHLDKEQTMSATSDAQGIARVRMHAPTYTDGDVGSVLIRAEIQHPAYGAAAARCSLGLAVPLLLEAEAVPPNGGLVPELDGRLYFRVKDGGGEPPPPGTGIEVSGAAVAGGTQRLKTDRDGLAVVHTLLPPGASTPAENGVITTVKVRVEGEVPRTATILVPVLPNLSVVPTVQKPVVAPGDSLTVRLSRRPSARGRPVVVELLSETGLVASVIAEAQTNLITLRIPPDRIGVMRVRARLLTQSGTDEGEGGVDALLCRPARPSFLKIQADRDLYEVRSTAKLTLKTRADAPRSWGAVLVRDLALHQGEAPFVSRFLQESFERAVLDPDNAASETFLRTVMAAYVSADEAPASAPSLVDELGRPREGRSGLETKEPRQVLRDPFPLADELRWRGIAQVMKETEESLQTALDNGTLDEITVGRGSARRFRPELLAQLTDVPRTLGDGELTLEMVQASVPSFSYDNVARRVARLRLVKLLLALTAYLDPGDNASPVMRAAAREPYGRWLLRMVARNLIRAEDLVDPWGRRFALRPSQHPSLIVAREAASLELASAGPDGVFGTADDVNDIFARAVPAGTPYAIASGEDALLERLSYLSPGETVLTRLLEAYKRVAAEVAEEQRGEAVAAQISEGAFSDTLQGSEIGDVSGMGGLGTIGRGSGAGFGGVSGSARGTLSGRVFGVPMVEFAQLLREKFPPTLLFLPRVALAPSGETPLEIKLPDAVTTYLVEAIIWSQDGWTDSASTRIRVDKQITVEAPVPRYATAGDSLLLPLRVRNGGNAELGARVLVSVDGGTPVQRSGLLIAGNDAAEVSVALSLTQPMDGQVTIGLTSPAGVPLDAVRRPLTVLAPARRVRQAEDILVRGQGTLTLEVPEKAIPHEGAEVTVQVGLAMFPGSDGVEQAAWRDAWLGRADLESRPLSVPSPAGESPLRLAQATGSSWSLPAVSDSQLAASLTSLARAIGKLKSEDLGQKAAILLALAPAARKPGARGKKAADLESVLRGLRKDLINGVAGAQEDPELLATLAAALAATAPTGGDLALPRELVRRVRRSEVRVGSDTWIAASGARRHAATALVALAELLLGDYGRAFERVRTLSRIERSGGGLDVQTRTITLLLASLLSQGPEPTTVPVDIDGRAYKLALKNGVGHLLAPALANSGKHRIHVEVPGGHAAVYVRAATEYGLPWELAPAHAGSLRTAIEGQANARDEHAALKLLVQNRSPRTIGRPVLELSLPAGAELDEEGRQALGALLITAPEATRGTLHLELRPLPPGVTRRLPLPLRFSVAGRLLGLGIAAYPADQKEDLSLTKPRAWDIAATEQKP